MSYLLAMGLFFAAVSVHFLVSLFCFLAVFCCCFILELPSKMVSKAEYFQMLAGFSPIEGGSSIPLIQFADDSFYVEG